MSRNSARCGVGIGLIGLASLCLPGGASAQTPVYSTTQSDAVTGDNTPVSHSHPNGECPSGDPCYLPDPNPPAGASAVDDYYQDIYERPTGSGSSANEYFAALDITVGRVGFDDDWLYYRIDLYGTEGGELPYFYSFEINFDADGAGDMFVRVAAPSSNVGTTWGSNGVIGFLDQNNNVGGPNPLQPDGPGQANGGYEFLAFDQGSNNLPGSPGGSTAVQARVTPGNPNTVELAVRREFLVAANGNDPTVKASFRPYAARGATSEANLYAHDESTRSQMGSPFPFLQLAGAPAECPDFTDSGLTQAQRDALDSGTPVDTGILNPCYPSSQIGEFDNGGTVSDLASGATIQFEADLSVSKTDSPDPVSVNDTLTYAIAVANLETGNGEATGVQVVDSLPAGVTFLSATPSQGSCSGSAVVTCDLGAIANGDTATVSIVVLAPAAAGSLGNVARVAADQADPDTANNRAVEPTTVVATLGVSVTPDGTDLLQQLPSNGTGYRYGYRVTNDSDVTEAFDLFAFLGAAPFVTVDSIVGPNVSRAARADSARLAPLGVGASDSAFVWYRVGDVPAGGRDTLWLEARAATDGSVADSGWVVIEVVRPAIETTKSVDPTGTQVPGTDLTYTITVANTGSENAVGVVAVDSLPPEVVFQVGSVSSSFPPGISVTVEYSDDDGGSWTYTPVSGACGAPSSYDACVDQLRWSLQSDLGSAAPDNTGSMEFVVRIK